MLRYAVCEVKTVGQPTMASTAKPAEACQFTEDVLGHQHDSKVGRGAKRLDPSDYHEGRPPRTG